MANLIRPLTDSEITILALAQGYYGSWNSAEEVFVTERNEAVIFVKDAAGACPICVNLTVCASAFGDGSITLEELKSGWLQIPSSELRK